MATARVALITASSTGLGAAIAKALAPSMRVVINYNSRPSPAEKLLNELCEVSGHTSVNPESQWHALIQADVSKRGEINRLVAETIEKMGRLDVVVSNAGWTRITNFISLEDNMVEEDWDRCWDANVKSHLWLMHAVKPELDKSEGAFIMTASVAGVKPSGSSLAYAVTKAAQIHLGKSLSLICGPKIRVNSVSPSVLLTEWGLRFPEDALNASREKTILKRFATVEDVAEQVKCFALSRSITGQNVIVDAGFST